MEPITESGGGSQEAEAELAAELTRTTELRGFRYGLHDFLGALDVKLLQSLNDKIEQEYLSESLLDRKTKELLIIATCTAMGDRPSHLQIHMHAAKRAGASQEEILDALNLLKSWCGSVRMETAFEAWRLTFRPDIPTIDRVVELG